MAVAVEARRAVGDGTERTVQTLMLIGPRSAKVDRGQELRAGTRGRGPRLAHSRKSGVEIQILVQGPLDDGHQHRVVEPAPSVLERRGRGLLRGRGVGRVVERREIGLGRSVVRADCASRQGGAEQQAAQHRLADGSKLPVMTRSWSRSCG